MCPDSATVNQAFTLPRLLAFNHASGQSPFRFCTLADWTSIAVHRDTAGLSARPSSSFHPLDFKAFSSSLFMYLPNCACNAIPVR